VSCQSYQKTGLDISVGLSIVVIVTLSNSTFCSQLLFKNALKMKLQVQALFNLLNSYRLLFICIAEFDSVTHVFVNNHDIPSL
jgi:hypothetical protein